MMIWKFLTKNIEYCVMNACGGLFGDVVDSEVVLAEA